MEKDSPSAHNFSIKKRTFSKLFFTMLLLSLQIMDLLRPLVDSSSLDLEGPSSYYLWWPRSLYAFGHESNNCLHSPFCTYIKKHLVQLGVSALRCKRHPLAVLNAAERYNSTVWLGEKASKVSRSRPFLCKTSWWKQRFWMNQRDWATLMVIVTESYIFMSSPWFP